MTLAEWDSTVNISSWTHQKFRGPSALQSCVPDYKTFLSYQASVGCNNIGKNLDGSVKCVPDGSLTTPPGKLATTGKTALPTKVNSMEAATLTELLAMRDEIAKGGYTFTCRHEQTTWDMQPAEVFGCKLSDGGCVADTCDLPWKDNSTCTQSNSDFRQRQLDVIGDIRANLTGHHLKKAGLHFQQFHTSPFRRAKYSATAVSRHFENSDPVKVLRPLMYAGDPHGVAKMYGFKRSPNKDNTQLNVNVVAGTGLRMYLGESINSNRFASTHGFTQKVGVGQVVDESQCTVTKPVVSATYDNNGTITLPKSDINSYKPVIETVANSKKFNLLAVLSPEQIEKMAQSVHARDSLTDSPSSFQSSFMSADTNTDFTISEDEWAVYKGDHSQAPTWNKLRSFLPDPKYREFDGFPIGIFLYWNTGWREYKHSKGGWSFPTRMTLYDSILDIDEMRAHYSPIDVATEAVVNGTTTWAQLEACISETNDVSALDACPVHKLSTPTLQTTKDLVDITHIHNDLPLPPVAPDVAPIPKLKRLAVCLLDVVTPHNVLSKLGCISEYRTCHQVQHAYQTSQCCNADGNLVSTVPLGN
jgi:hypothetical protein